MQKRRYKPKGRASRVPFALFLVCAVLLVAMCCALVACRFRGDAVYTTVSEETVEPFETVSLFTVTVDEPEDSEPEAETTALPETAETTEITFTSVEEADGVRRVENFIFYETDTPEYRLAHLLFLEVPPVVKVVETTTAPYGGRPMPAKKPPRVFPGRCYMPADRFQLI